MYDAVVIGSGPNGLCAGIALQQAGARTVIVEGKETIGGGVRSAELTLPGFVHDSCAAIFPLSVASPFISSLPLEQFGLQWAHAPLPVAHPLDGGRAAAAYRSLDETAEALGRDAGRYRFLYRHMLRHWPTFSADLLGPLPLPPEDIITFMRFGAGALLPATTLARLQFRTEEARALFIGMSAHSMLALNSLSSAAYGLVIGATTHAVGWPFPIGGAQKIADALAGYYRSLGGEIVTGCMVRSLEDVPEARAVLFDVTPRQLLRMMGPRFPESYQRSLQRYRYGVGVFKIDYALDGPVPWLAEAAHQTATLHLGGAWDDIARAEDATARGKHPQRPYVLVAQPSLFDRTRAPQGKHTLWAYCHVPHGSRVDMTEAIEGQIERFAPGFKKLVLARKVRGPAEMEAHNPNYIGGDINGGVQDIWQLYNRPALRLNPYSTPVENVFICSSSTPPGGGVHGMSGYHAAQSALRYLGG
jgi:phytoene dehydrogenase-like protein